MDKEKVIKDEDKTYAQLWRDTVVDPVNNDHLLNGRIIGGARYLFGTKGLTKMMEFYYKAKLDNEIIDKLMALDPREEGEDMHLTSQFQKALLKYRYKIYKYPQFNAKQLKIRAKNKKHIKNESTTINAEA